MMMMKKDLIEDFRLLFLVNDEDDQDEGGKHRR